MDLRKFFLILISILLFALAEIIGQDQDPYNVLDSVREKLTMIRDYSADIEIEVDVEFINMPVKRAKIFYKRPDKIKFTSNEFIMLPKRGMNNQILNMMEEPYTAIYLGKEDIQGKEHIMVRIVPMDKNPQIILATIWVDCTSFLIGKSESNTRDEGSYKVEFEYNDPNITLPTLMTFFFDVEKLNIPLNFIGKTNGMEMDKSKMEEANVGKVYLRLSNYSINQGIPDDFFEDTEESEIPH